MSQYRDEREALRARCESLEQELGDAHAELDELRGDGPAEERIERLSAELAEAAKELARLRGDAPVRVPLLFGGATGSIGVAVLATMWLLGAGLGAPPAGQRMESGSVLGAQAPHCPRIASNGVVTDVSGATDVERDAACDVAVIPFDDACKVRVRCDGAWLYDGFALPRPDGRVVDDRPSVVDLDPRIEIDARTGRAAISDDGENGSYSIEVDFSDEN
jgi:hypothetical protein